MSTETTVVHHALLRDGANWETTMRSGLEVVTDGALELARVPGLASGAAIDLAGPYAVDASGIAVGECGDVYLSDTDHHRVIWIDGICGARCVLPSRGGSGTAPGHFSFPRGLALAGRGLQVADSGNARVQIFRTPTLEVRSVWNGFVFQTPTGLATDGSGRVYVLDRGKKTVLRFVANGAGAADTAFNAKLRASLAGAGVSPLFLAVDPTGKSFVSAEAAPAILRFDAEGNALPGLSLGDGPAMPAALALSGSLLFAADTTGGRIWVCDINGGSWLGALESYRGPVAAMTCDASGALYVKPGAGEVFHRLEAGAAHVGSGQLIAGPLDAGEQRGWFRLHAEAVVPADTEVSVAIYVSETATDTPVFTPQPSLDVMLPQFVSAEQPALKNVYPTATPPPDRVEPFRYLWLRVRLKSGGGGLASPRLAQVHAETPGEDYLNYLPEVYRRRDRIERRPIAEPQDIGFLRRWLSLFRAELGDLEGKLDRLPRLFNAATVPESALPWLAAWLAFDLPPGTSIQSRERLARALEIYRRRGTLAGIRDFVELYTGIRPIIVESFREPRWWLLGEEASVLGCNTALSPLSPQGLVVPDPERICNPECDPKTPGGCTTDRLVVGAAVVGGSGPLTAEEFGEPLFDATAHRFSVFVYGPQLKTPDRRTEVERVIAAERPAHTDYDLCIVEPRMRIGLQSVIGINSYVAGDPPPLALSGSVLGLNSNLGDEPGERGASRVSRRARVGSEIRLE